MEYQRVAQRTGFAAWTAFLLAATIPLIISCDGKRSITSPQSKTPPVHLSADVSAPGTATVRVTAYIDGLSRLILRAGTAQWLNVDHAAPGLWLGNNFPTTINGVDWFPVWPEPGENRSCNCLSSIFEGLVPALPAVAQTVTLTLIQARHVVQVTEQPNAANDYSAVIEFDDNLPNGPDFYTVDISFSPYQSQAITFTSASPNPGLLGGTYVATATGGGSGNPVTFSSLTPSVCTNSGSTVSLIAVGICTIAADQAGSDSHLAAPQATQTFSVAYAFAGFFSPVDNLPTTNVAQAGSAIPVKFSLGGDEGLGILPPGSPSSARYACTSAQQDLIEETVTATTSGLQFAGDSYIYVWKTEKSWAGTCRQFVLKLTDGTIHRANFQFR